MEIVRKSDYSLFARVALPRFPAIEIDGSVVFQGQDITHEELERAIVSTKGG